MAFFCCSFSEGVTQSHPLTYLPKTSAILSFTSAVECFTETNLSSSGYIESFGACILSKRSDLVCFTGYNLCFRDYIGCFSGYDLVKDRMGNVLGGVSYVLETILDVLHMVMIIQRNPSPFGHFLPINRDVPLPKGKNIWWHKLVQSRITVRNVLLA